MKLICPECKNDVNLSSYPNLKRDDVIECNMCGINLMIVECEDQGCIAEVVDEGK